MSQKGAEKSAPPLKPQVGKPEREKLLAYGFSEEGGSFVKTCRILDGQFEMTVRISENGALKTRVVDVQTKEEYVLHRVARAAGEFVGTIRAEHDRVLAEIAAACFARHPFRTEGANAVLCYARDAHGAEPEFLWKRSPKNAVLRRQDNQKWYAVLLTVPGRKLGLPAEGETEILDLRARPEEIARLTRQAGFLPGYHMNKAHWVSLLLDGTVPTEKIFRCMDESFALAGSGRKK